MSTVHHLNGCLSYPASGSRPSYPAPDQRPPKNFQSAQPPPTKSPVSMIMYTLFSIVYGLFKPCWLIHAACTCFKETALLFNVHLSCFMNFILCPTDKYIFKFNNEKIKLICWMCSKLKPNATWHLSGVFIVDFDQSQYINRVFLLLTLNKHLSVGSERQVIMFWKHKKWHTCFVLKVARSVSSSDLSLHRIEMNYEQMTILWTYYRAVGSFFMGFVFTPYAATRLWVWKTIPSFEFACISYILYIRFLCPSSVLTKNLSKRKKVYIKVFLNQLASRLFKSP